MILTMPWANSVTFRHPLQHARRNTPHDMSNAQLFVAAGSPTAASLASIAVALILNGRLETRIESINDRVGGRIELLGSRIDRVAADLSQFYMIFCRDDKAIETLETK